MLEGWGKANPHSLSVELQNRVATLKPVLGVLKNLKVNLPYDPASLLFGIRPGNSTSYATSTGSAVFIAGLFTLVRK